jgi:hypothetical protein
MEVSSQLYCTARKYGEKTKIISSLIFLAKAYNERALVKQLSRLQN